MKLILLHLMKTKNFVGKFYLVILLSFFLVKSPKIMTLNWIKVMKYSILKLLTIWLVFICTIYYKYLLWNIKREKNNSWSSLINIFWYIKTTFALNLCKLVTQNVHVLKQTLAEIWITIFDILKWAFLYCT